MGDLSDSDRTTLLELCVCGHTINDHGSMGTCWTCSDEGLPDCKFHFEDLLTERIEAIVAARLARVEAQLAAMRFRVNVACDGYSALMPDDAPEEYDHDEWLMDAYIAGAADAARQIRAALTGQPASDHPAEAL